MVANYYTYYRLHMQIYFSVLSDNYSYGWILELDSAAVKSGKQLTSYITFMIFLLQLHGNLW